MENYVRDNIEWGKGDLANSIDGKDPMPLDDHHHSRHQKQIVWHCRVLHEDIEKVSQ